MGSDAFFPGLERTVASVWYRFKRVFTKFPSVAICRLGDMPSESSNRLMAILEIISILKPVEIISIVIEFGNLDEACTIYYTYGH